jgi:hypothetical protein
VERVNEVAVAIGEADRRSAVRTLPEAVTTTEHAEDVVE